MKRWTPDRIRQLRKRLGLTQAEFADELGYKRYQTISEFENGEREPPATTQKVLDAMHERATTSDE